MQIQKYLPRWPKPGATHLDWVLISTSQKLLYVEVPKAACTKIRTLLILLNRGADDPQLAQFLHSTKPAPYYHWEFGVTDNRSIDATQLASFFADQSYFKFAFVRNPYARLVSAYTDKVYQTVYQGNAYYTHVAKTIKAETKWQPSGRISVQLAQAIQQIEHATQRRKLSDSVVKPKDYQDDPTIAANGYDYQAIAQRIAANYGKKATAASASRISETVKTHLCGYPKLDEIDLYQEPVSFAEFIRYICNQPSATLDVHWRPQTICLGYDALTYDFIGQVEHFDRDMRALFEKIDAPAYIYDHIQGRMNVVPKECERTMWTQELADLVYMTYRADFEAFGYPKDSYRNDG